MAEAQPVHISNLTIQHFPKTSEGQAMVGSQEVFCLDGKLYQGYKGAIANVDEKTLLDTELEAVHNVDGTIDRIMSIRKTRLGSAEYRREEELSRRYAVRRDQKRKDLELAKLEREELSVVTTVMVPDPTEAAPAHITVMCGECGKKSPDDHSNPHMWLNGHMAHHKRSKNK